MPENNDIGYLEFPQVVVVEASAGSGKTYCLTKRYLQLLINSHLKPGQIPLRNILAITFTNKATLEMKERILEFLKKLALDAFRDEKEENDILALLKLDKKLIRDKATLIMDELIKHYNFFQVQTIDSFINALLLGCSLNIERSASFKIKRDYLQYLCLCLDSLTESAREEKETLRLLEEFLQHYLFVENKKGWFPKEDILQLLRSLFNLSNKYGKAFSPFAGEPKDIIKKKKYVFGRIKELSGHFPPGMNAAAKKHIFSFLDKNEPIFDIANLPAALKNPEVPMNKDETASPDFAGQWSGIYGLLKELSELEARTAYNPYVKLYRRIADSFQLLSRKEDVLFLEELNRKARLLFDQEGITVAEVYYRLATRFKHYLIDEFQDTSLLQWQNLKLMVQEALSSGGSLFYVGDKKQAIYRFRGGEAKLFDAVRREFTHFNVKNAYLTRNWRSQQAIVEFNNKVFSGDNLKVSLTSSGIIGELGEDNSESGEILDIFKDTAQAGQKSTPYGYVHVERLQEKSKQERNEIMRPKILELLKELQGRFGYEDIAVLTRDNSEVELVTSWLLEAGFSVESEKTLNVVENSLVKEVISFLNFLCSPLDDLSFAGFILGRIFSRAAGISSENITRFIFDLHRKEKAGTRFPLYRLFRQKYPQIWERYIDKFFKNVGFISPYELVVGIYQTLDVTGNFKEDIAFFLKFLELIKQHEDDYVGLAEFLSYLKEAPQDDLYVNAAHSNSLKVLTIHKSKGLEFGVVIIPFLRMDISPETGEKNSSSYVIPDGDKDLRMVRITKDYRAYSPFLQKIYSQSYKEACIDELNNIYVALTRAQFELYIFIPAKSANSINKARYLIPEDIKEWGQKRNYEREDKDAQPAMEIFPLLRQEWLEAASGEFTAWCSVKERQRLLEGNIMHTLLSQIRVCEDCAIEELINEALRVAKSCYPFVKDFPIYEGKLRRLLKKDELKDIFFTPAAEVFCEKEVANRFGDGKRIDRLINKGEEVWVVDYKSSREAEGRHAKQVSEYIRIVQDIYSGVKVRGFLVYLDEMVKEEVK